ncbi:MAG: TonB-dependent receptor [Gemmatimonadaceae bacterium]
MREPGVGSRLRGEALRCGLALIAAGALGRPAHAQQRDSVPADSAGADSARRAATPRSRPPTPQRLAPQVITGTRLSGAADEKTPGQVDVVQLRAAPPGPAATAEALRRLPGVSGFDDQGSRAQPSLDVRGFTLSPVVGVPQGVSVFLDGVRVNEPDAQQVHFDLLPAEAIDRAELVRGPAALFGKNTLGGALSLTTRRGEATPVLDGGVDVGPYGYRAARAVASGVRRGIDGFLLLRGSDEDGYRRDTETRTRLLFGTVGRRGDAGDLALSLLAARDRVGQAGSLPESWLAEDRRANYTTGDFFEPHLTHVALRGERALGGGGARLRANAFVRRNATEQFNVNVGAPSTRAFVTNLGRGGTAELALPLRLGALPLGLSVGAEYARSDVKYAVDGEPGPFAGGDSTGECVPQGGESRVRCEDARVDEDDAALYAQGVLSITERLSATAGARWDYVRLPFRDLTDPENDGTSSYRRLSPRVGLNLELPGAVRAYAVAAGGFRAPAALELACADEAAPCPLPFSLGDDPPLAPVKVRNVEAGLDWEPSRRGAVEASVYRTEVRDEIVFVAATGTAGFFQNVPRTRRQGVELSANAALPAGARAFASYTYTDATYRGTVRLASALPGADSARRGDRFPLSPAHRATAGVGITRARHATILDAELSARALSSQFLRGDEANDHPPLPGYATADLRVSLERPHWALSAAVTNLLDRRYESFGIYAENPLGAFPGHFEPAAEAPVERFLSPGYPRTLTLTVRVKR